MSQMQRIIGVQIGVETASETFSIINIAKASEMFDPQKFVVHDEK
jgi:hypothetical protein